MFVSINFERQPLGAWMSADHQEEPSRGRGFRFPSADREAPGGPAVAASADNLSAQPDADVRCFLDLADQISGHAGVQRVRPHDYGDLPAYRARYNAACPAEFAPPRM